MPKVASSGGAIHYDVNGQGRPLVLLHGGANDRGVWEPAGYLEPLSDEFQVVTVDLRGAGESTSPSSASDHQMDLYVEDVLAVLEELAIQRGFIWGVSMGGQVGLALAAAYPDRVRALVIAGADLEGWSASPDEYRGFADAIESEGMSVVIEGFDDPNDPLPSWMTEAMRRTDHKAFAASMRARADWPGIEQDVERLAMPVLFIGGEEEYEADVLESMAAKVPDGRALRIPNANHIQAFINSDFVVPHVIKFFQSNA